MNATELSIHKPLYEVGVKKEAICSENIDTDHRAEGGKD